MKKTIITGSLVLATILGVSAADFLEVSKVAYQGGNTTVSYTRYSTDQNNTYVFFTMDKFYKGNLSAQEAVVKGSYLIGSNATSTSKLAGTSPVAGQVDTLASLRSQAWKTGGIVAYFTELARQIALEI